jgi:large subunit ribosomal protein L21
MYAIFVTGGKQYKASVKDILYIEKLELPAGETVVFDKVLLYSDDGVVKTGTPYIEGAKVEAKLEKNGKGKKIRIFKYKAKKNYRKRIGHRQPYSKVEITAVNV